MTIKYVVEKIVETNYECPQLSGIWYMVKPQHKILDILNKFIPVYAFLGIPVSEPFTNLEKAKQTALAKTKGLKAEKISHGTIYDPEQHKDWKTIPTLAPKTTLKDLQIKKTPSESGIIQTDKLFGQPKKKNSEVKKE